ncbi:endonuclease domain-containing protein [Phenylobacterium sp.]|uniref:endonuclease domain-containing protein n=1 Tax=Phenylobacterium sp. TaxID=1871053 RepID=UPI0025EBE77D|nr:endonuclease domain-containing protein [Phenylobacterium sp.]
MFEHAGIAPGTTVRAKGLRRRMTWSEQALWKELRKLSANIRRQAPVGRYIADFACHSGKLVIEVDGGIHERLDEVALRDAERQRWLEGEGYRVLRFTNRQVEDDVLACADAVRLALALSLDGGGLGGGVASEPVEMREWAPAPNGASDITALHSPPSPALPPSRGKGERFSGGSQPDRAGE